MENVEVVNDLIQINNDRIEGYTKAAKQADDADLQLLFINMASQSKNLIKELKPFVQKEGEEPADGTTVSGKLYRTWMDVKATFGGDDRKSILESCEFGEDAAQKAYTLALDEENISADVRQLIEKQKSELYQSHNRVKTLRDTQIA